MKYTVKASKFHGATTEELYEDDLWENTYKVAKSMYIFSDYRDVWVYDNETNQVVWHNANLTTDLK